MPPSPHPELSYAAPVKETGLPSRLHTRLSNGPLLVRNVVEAKHRFQEDLESKQVA